MDRNKVKSFTISEFAKWFDIKKDTLYYYDKIGLFKPAGTHENGYRYYTMAQLDLYWIIYTLRELNFPIKTLFEYINSPSATTLVNSCTNQLDAIEKEISKLSSIKKHLSLILDYTHEALNAPIQQLLIEKIPQRTYLYSKTLPKEKTFDNDVWFSYYTEFFKEAGLKGSAYVGSVVNKKEILNHSFTKISKLFVQWDGVEAQSRAKGLYAIMYHKGSYDSIITTYENLLRAIDAQGYEICGNAHEEYLLSVLSTLNEDDYITKISIKIKTKL